MSVSDAMLSLLGDIFSNTEANHKISVTVDYTSKSISVTYEDLDEDCFLEVYELLGNCPF
jgi:hypothetical protein